MRHIYLDSKWSVTSRVSTDVRTSDATRRVQTWGRTDEWRDATSFLPWQQMICYILGEYRREDGETSDAMRHVSSANLSGKTYVDIHCRKMAVHLNTRRVKLYNINDASLNFRKKHIGFENTPRRSCTVVFLSHFLGRSIDDLQRHFIGMQGKAFFTSWPWHLTYALNLWTWPRYPSTWPTYKQSDLYVCPFGRESGNTH